MTEDDIQDQLAGYDTLGWFSSARKLSVICLSFSMVMTLIMTVAGIITAEAYVDAGLMALLAIFIYRGHRWAMIVAMLLWTLEKIDIAITGLSPTRPSHAGSIITSVLWWAVYMHAFYLAFRVEQEKRKRSADGLLTGQDLSVWD